MYSASIKYLCCALCSFRHLFHSSSLLSLSFSNNSIFMKINAVFCVFMDLQLIRRTVLVYLKIYFEIRLSSLLNNYANNLNKKRFYKRFFYTTKYHFHLSYNSCVHDIVVACISCL